MTLKELGLNDKAIEAISYEKNDDTIARVIVEHKDRYVIQTAEEIYQAEITGGGLAFTCPFPFTWIVLLLNSSAWRFAEKQIIASNVDIAFLMQSVGHDFNLNRLERYIAICNASSIEPVILISKTDLISSEELAALTDTIKKRLKNIIMTLNLSIQHQMI